MEKKIDLRVPRGWNECTTDQLETIAKVLLEQVASVDRYHPFSMETVKIALFFAFTGIEILEAPNPEKPIQEQSYLCRLGNSLFPLNISDIQYWISRKADAKMEKDSAEYLLSGAGVLDWIDGKTDKMLTRFPYPTFTRRKHSDCFFPLFREKKTFQGPGQEMDGFSWAQYRFAADAMEQYLHLSNSLVVMKEKGGYSEEQFALQVKNVNLAKSYFLATIFNAKVDFVDVSTGMVCNGFHYKAQQTTENAAFFYDFPEYKWQVVLFWWSGMMHMLNKRYPRVFKVQKVKKRAEKQSPFDIYSATIATMQKYVGVNEKECNNQSYSLVLEQMERMSRENEELERLNKKK